MKNGLAKNEVSGLLADAPPRTFSQKTPLAQCAVLRYRACVKTSVPS